MSVMHGAILLPILISLFIPLLAKRLPNIHTGWFVLVVPVLLVSYFSRFLAGTMSGETFTARMPWIPSLGIDFVTYLDGLGLLFALLITGIGSLVVLYSIFYLDAKKESLETFYVYLLMFMTAMLGVVLSDNMIVLYLFWELTSISSFLLIAYWYERERSRYGAQKSMLITVFGGLAMLGGIAILSTLSGSLSIRETYASLESIQGEPFFSVALVLFLLAAFTKSAQFPFHIWLPDAMEAPTPVSAYLHSATMVKAGLYLVARFSPIFADESLWFYLVSSVGIFTLFWGSLNAVKQHDLKGILAYSTISQLGLIMSLLGLGAAALHVDALDDGLYTIATVAAIFHLINHATFKGSLFMMAGIVDHETGTRDIRKLGGLAQLMPISMTIAMIGTLSMAGIPPFNGFLSKEMFLTGVLEVSGSDLFHLPSYGWIIPVLAVVGSIFTFVYSILIVRRTFFGKRQDDKLPKTPHEAPIGMLIPPLVLVSLVVIIGLFPNLLSDTLIRPAVEAILPQVVDTGGKIDVHISMWHGFNTELFLTLLIISAGVILYKTLPRWQSLYNRMPRAVSLNHQYDALLRRGEQTSTKIHDTVMTGYMRSYLVYIFGFIVILILTALYGFDAFRFAVDPISSIEAYEIILALVLVSSALSITFARSRLTSIILLGVTGYTVALFFVLFRAPDLALTQLVIETVSVALFLLVFYRLPEISRKEERIPFKLGNALISALVGLTVTLVALASLSQRSFTSIAKYYIDNVADLAAGGNMVNVILVDFRGFDTLFEIAVLALAGIGIYTMIKFRRTGGMDK